MLKALASLPGNEKAFAKLNDKPLQQTEYKDDTLDGRGDNKYFYRIRPIDEIGNMGPFSLATLPIELPKVTPPIAPVITQISGGDRQITVKWSSNPGAGILGYLVLRTDQKTIVDMRNMELLKLNPGDTYSVAVTNQGKLEFEFTDTAVVPRTPYYYGIVAVTVGEGGKKLLTRLLPVKSAQAYQSKAPLPPNWDSAAWNSTQDAIELSWSPVEPNLEHRVQRRREGEAWRNITDWLPVGQTSVSDNTAEVTENYYYRITARNSNFDINTLCVPRLVLAP